MKLCAQSFVIGKGLGKVGSYDPGRDDEYDHVFCGMPRGHAGMHVALIWFWDDDEPETDRLSA